MTTHERLYGLLPAVVRTRDFAAGQPLRALMSVLDDELAALRTATEAMWDDWFVETCAEDRLALIAAALGLPDLDAGGEAGGVGGVGGVGTSGLGDRRVGAGPSRRAWVANAVRRRRRQGTPATLADLAADVTRYPARAVELAERTVTTARLDRRAPAAARGTADLRSPADLGALDGAFDPFGHLADLRRVSDGVARPRPAVVGLFLWRTQPQPLSLAGARPIDGFPGAYRIDPLGADVPLVHLPAPGRSGGRVTGPADTPHPISRLELQDALRSPAPAPVRVRVVSRPGAGTEPIPRSADLSRPGAQRPPNGHVLVDPQLGCLRLADGEDLDADGAPVEVLVDHCWGAPGPLGAGPADRTASWAAQHDDLDVRVDRTYRVDRDFLPEGDPDIDGAAFPDLAGAVAAWNGWVRSLPLAARRDAVGLIAITDSRRHLCPEEPLDAPDGSRVSVVASGRRPPFTRPLRPADVLPARARPCLVGDLRVVGTPADRAEGPGGIQLNGLLVDGAVRVEPGRLPRLDLARCTVVGGVEVGAALDARMKNTALEIDLAECVTGPLRADWETGSSRRVSIAGVRARDCALQAPNPAAIDDDPSPAHAVDLRGAVVTLARCTVLGGLRCRALTADDCLLDPDGGLPPLAYEIEVRQEGSVRFSYVPLDALMPRRRYACQPPEFADDATVLRLRPAYESRKLGTPGFLVLASSCAPELRAAAADGGEPGVWHDLGHTHRMAALTAAVPQSLRFGLQAAAILER